MKGLGRGDNKLIKSLLKDARYLNPALPPTLLFT